MKVSKTLMVIKIYMYICRHLVSEASIPMGNAKFNVTPFIDLKLLNLNNKLTGYVGLYHRI